MKLLVEASPVVPLVTIGVTFRAGRADEPSGLDGLARVTAQMLRRGADGARAVEHRLDRLGAELAAEVGLGATTVSLEVLARGVEPAAALLAELLAEPSADTIELARVLRQSKASLVQSREDDEGLASRALRRHLFAGHPHGRRVLGTLAGLDAIASGDVAAFARRFYTQASAIVHISGDITAAAAERVAARLYDALPDGQLAPYPAPETTPPVGRHLVIVDKRERTQTQLAIGTLGTRLEDPDYHALTVANAAFGGTFSSRLTQAVRAERGWSYGASSQLTTGRVREAFSMWTAPSVEDAADCLALELELLGEWHAGGIDQAELDQCRQYLVRSYAFEIDTPHKRLQQALERVMLGLPDDFHARYLERIAAVTVDEANAAVRRRISPRDLWIACVADAGQMRDELAGAAGELVETLVEAVDVA